MFLHCQDGDWKSNRVEGLARGGEDGMSGTNFEKLVVAANSWNRQPERKTLIIQLLHNPTHLAKSKCHYE